jgi:hypothetical protein
MNNAPQPQDALLAARLERAEQALSNLLKGLSLLGVRACCRCGACYRMEDTWLSSNCGESVCYGCVPQWWQQRAQELDGAERLKMEHRLAAWLDREHGCELSASVGAA